MWQVMGDLAEAVVTSVATLRYLGVVAPGRVETWLDCLRTALHERYGEAR